MNKINNGLVVLVIILSVLDLGLGSYIIYDKTLKEDTDVSNNNMDNDIILLSQNDALELVKVKTKKYFEYYHAISPYCGETDSKDYISFGSYETQDFRDYNASNTFISINELKEYYSSFMVEKLYPKNLDNGVLYVEKDNKLYCQLSHKGCGDTYNEEASYYTIHLIDENTIVANVILASNTCGDELTRREGMVTLVNVNGTWLISKYDVQLSDLD